MKNEPQIFTRTDDQSVPVDDAILGALEQEELAESLIRECIREILLTEVAKAPADLTDDMRVVIQDRGSHEFVVGLLE